MRFEIIGHSARQKRFGGFRSIGHISLCKPFYPSIIGAEIDHFAIAQTIGGHGLKTGPFGGMLSHICSLNKTRGYCPISLNTSIECKICLFTK